MAAPGLAAQLEALLRQLAGGVGSAGSGNAVLEAASAVHSRAAQWQAGGGDSEEEASALHRWAWQGSFNEHCGVRLIVSAVCTHFRGICSQDLAFSVHLPLHYVCSAISSAATRLSPLLGTLRQRLPTGRAPPVDAVEPVLVRAACEAMATCLLLAPACGTSSSAQLQLAQAALGCLASSGLVLLQGHTAGPDSSSLLAQARLKSNLMLHLELAIECLLRGGVSAAAAAEVVPPDQLAAWLSAVVAALQQLGEGGRAGG